MKFNFRFSIWERNPKQIVKHFSIGNGSSKTNSENEVWLMTIRFWTGDDDGMAQKYTDPRVPYLSKKLVSGGTS